MDIWAKPEISRKLVISSSLPISSSDGVMVTCNHNMAGSENIENNSEAAIT